MLEIKSKVLSSNLEGLGLFADEDILGNQLVYKKDKLFVKEFTPDEVNSLSEVGKEFVRTYCYTNAKGNFELIMDNWRFINHSFTPNCYWHNGDLFAAKYIYKGEELTHNYNDITGIENEVDFEVKG
jgi:uncharacterized protein